MKADKIQDRKVSQKFLHPKYDARFFDFDIGIAKVDKAFDFNDIIGKIDMPILDYEPRGKLHNYENHVRQVTLMRQVRQ
jgi:hypothetical protein